MSKELVGSVQDWTSVHPVPLMRPSDPATVYPDAYDFRCLSDDG